MKSSASSSFRVSYVLLGLLLLFFASNVVQSARILCVFPSPSKSHVLVGQSLLKGLAARGHEVTMVSAFKLSKPVKNYRDVIIPLDHDTSEQMKRFLNEKPNLFKELPKMMKSMMETANSTINHPKMEEIKREQFDLVIAGVFVADYILGFGPHFDAPTVVLWSAGLTKITADLVGNPRALSAVPHIMLGTSQTGMGFVDRLKNFLIGAAENAFSAFSVYQQRKYYDYNFPANRYPAYEDVRKNVSLLLLNTHFSHAGPRPYIQNVVEVGGLQIKTKPGQLPEDIKQWLDGAEHGAIYFCLGSNVKVSDMPMEKVQIFVKSLAKLKQRILWKSETEFMNVMPNVMTKSWVPQDDVLAHKNVVLFISHGGLGGMAEARYHGVPVLGIPLFAEQSSNVEAVAREGWGQLYDYHQLNEETFDQALNQMLGNPQFKLKAKEASAVYRDRPKTAMETACFWIEYIIRHKGAPHMHYPGADLNFIEQNMLDVIAVLLAVVYIVFKVIKLILKGLIRLCCGKSKKQKTN
ncbi:UDP-glucosyltransferase 2-like [Uranotaenia lowii]|uniref:UDP-glucosyltransferase 2-like n=1 Tax=Uranotaenia lowii TaxID=190385 RepID=UPI00247AE779|nr:UDP-glucosyltransferase 2-like [Uranotaenia lowii]